MTATPNLCSHPVKKAQIILYLLAGIVLGVASAVGFQYVRRPQAVKALPSLADRNMSPIIDEIPGVTLSRRDGRLQYDVRGGMGHPHQDFQALVAESRAFGIEDPIWYIHWEPGVTMEDVDSTLKTIHALGVRRYFVGAALYGKLVAP